MSESNCGDVAAREGALDKNTARAQRRGSFDPEIEPIAGAVGDPDEVDAVSEQNEAQLPRRGMVDYYGDLLSGAACSGQGPILDGSIAKYQLGEKLGEGGFGKVFACVLVAARSGPRAAEILENWAEKPLAVKIVSGLRNDQVEAAVQECRILEHAQQTGRVVPLVEFWRVERGLHGSQLAIVMARADCDLATFVKSLKKVTQEREQHRLYRETVEWFARECIACLAAVHRLGYVHLDLKMPNFLLMKDEKTETKSIPEQMFRVVLTDFGMSRQLRQEDTATPFPGETSNQEMSEGKRNASSTTGFHVEEVQGTHAYMAPEQFRAHGYEKGKKTKITKKTDVFSLGIVCSELLLESHPFSHLFRGGMMNYAFALAERQPPQVQAFSTARSVLLNALSSHKKREEAERVVFIFSWVRLLIAYEPQDRPTLEQIQKLISVC